MWIRTSCLRPPELLPPSSGSKSGGPHDSSLSLTLCPSVCRSHGLCLQKTAGIRPQSLPPQPSPGPGCPHYWLELLRQTSLPDPSPAPCLLPPTLWPQSAPLTPESGQGSHPPCLGKVAVLTGPARPGPFASRSHLTLAERGSLVRR